ncbi:MAG: hypothetical protein KZQ83_14760 [gamma proteobacterium symbiont of Taylorina sp.]|nr:hypothetical protein [gamma proteobacterium symbiont of Taylorina sp.]
MSQLLYSFKDTAAKIGYRPSSGEPFRQLYLLCKKLGVIDSKREPLAPYKFKDLFEVKTVTFPNKLSSQAKAWSSWRVLLQEKEFLESEKWPREYAAEILQMKTRGERTAALNKVPEHLRNWVIDYVVTEFEMRKYR